MADQVPVVKGDEGDKPLTGGPVPGVTLEQLNESIQKSVSSAVQQHMRESQEDRPSTQQPAIVGEDKTNPLESIIAPIVEPGMRQARQMAEAAQDAAVFYGTNPGAAVDKDRIEKVFNNMLAQNTPIARQAIQNYLWGMDKDKIVDEAIKKHDAEIAKAKEAADGGGSQNPGGRSSTPVEAFGLPAEDLAKALEGATF